MSNDSTCLDSKKGSENRKDSFWFLNFMEAQRTEKEYCEGPLAFPWLLGLCLSCAAVFLVLIVGDGFSATGCSWATDS